MLSPATLARTGSASGVRTCMFAQPPWAKPPRGSSSGRPGACMTPSSVRFMNTTTLLTGSSLRSAPVPCRLLTLYTNGFRPDRHETAPGGAPRLLPVRVPHAPGSRSMGVHGGSSWVPMASNLHRRMAAGEWRHAPRAACTRGVTPWVIPRSLVRGRGRLLLDQGGLGRGGLGRGGLAVAQDEQGKHGRGEHGDGADERGNRHGGGEGVAGGGGQAGVAGARGHLDLLARRQQG